MHDFDKYIKSWAAKDFIEVPDSVKNRIEQALADLPEKSPAACAKRMHVFPRVAAAAAGFIFTTLFLLPNISASYGQALQQVPVIGDIVRVVTIRNYFYSDDKHEMNIDVPKVEDANNTAFDSINEDVKTLTDALMHRFYDDLASIGDNGHSSVYVDYETITNSSRWFTLKLRVHEAAGSSNTYFKYYHFNKCTGKIVKLGDMASDDGFYDAVQQEIESQMLEAMQKDSDLKYWVQDSMFGNDIVSIHAEHNFYWNENGDLVIPFDKYEVAPGYMGTPEFTIEKDLIVDFLLPEFADTIS